MWKKYCPVIPVESQGNALYAKPEAAIMAKVKDEKLFRAEARKVLKAKKYVEALEAVKDIAFGSTV